MIADRLSKLFDLKTFIPSFFIAINVRLSKSKWISYSEEKLKLLSKLINNMESYFDGKVRIGVTTKNEMDSINAKVEDAHDLVNYLRTVLIFSIKSAHAL